MTVFCKAYAAWSNDLSAIGFASNCIPIGNPFDTVNGIDIAGFPVRFAVTVLMSTKNREIGSSIFSPILNGKIGTVGESK